MTGKNQFAQLLSRATLLAAIFLITHSPQAGATWSMTLVDTNTGEVALGQATCVPGVDMLDSTSIMVTRTGGATVAGYINNIDHAREIIMNGLMAGATPEEVLETLSSEHPQFETHQYCIVDSDGNSSHYTGTGVSGEQFDWTGGRAGRSGNIAYAVMGGLLAGSPVVDQAVQAIIETEGDLCAKLMAAMMAARDMGGDGRCSCSASDPTGCGSPPPIFDSAAINGYMALARAGDVDSCLNCSDVDLFMRFNVAGQAQGDPDPVLMMREQYDTWRAELLGRPDAVRSLAEFDPPILPSDGVSTTQLTITLRDWDDGDVTAPISSVAVAHAPDSAGLSTVGKVVDNGNGTFTIEITAGNRGGRDRFLVTIENGIRPVILMPEPVLYLSGDPLIITGPGEGPDNVSDVHGFTLDPVELVLTIDAYGVDRFGVNIAVGDIDGNGVDEIISGAGPGAVFGPHVRGFEGDGTAVSGVSFLAYGTNRFGVNVAAGDIDGDGYAEIITGAGPGAVFGPHVRAWNVDDNATVRAVPGVSFFAYGTPKWGVNVAAGDIDGDGYAEIITGAGPGAVYGPHVRGWNVDGGEVEAIPEVSFFAYGTLKFGVNVTAGDIDGDGIDEIVTGAGPGAVFGPHVRGWNYDGSALSPLPGSSFFAWETPPLRYGVNVFAGADLNGDGRDELIAGRGPDPEADSEVRVFTYNGSSMSAWISLEAYPGQSYGTNVASGRF